VSQMLTLYTTPVVYLYMDRLRAWLSGDKVLRPLKIEEEKSARKSAYKERRRERSSVARQVPLAPRVASLGSIWPRDSGMIEWQRRRPKGEAP